MNKVTKKEAFEPATVELIKKTIAVGATDTELQMFLYQAQKSGLDPLSRQIYFLKRRVWNKAKNGYDEKANISASIDGLRLVAQRSGDYAGQDEPAFKKEVNGIPGIAKVTVYKFSSKGERYPAAVGVAYWNEYCPKEGQDFMWKKMPHTMLSKVAEALALRKAFPQELSGIYSAEEMDQAGVEIKEPEPIKEADWIEGKTEQKTEESELPSETLKNVLDCTCGSVGKYHKVDCPAGEKEIKQEEQVEPNDLPF